MNPDLYSQHNTNTPCPGCGAPIHTVWTNDDPGSPWTECGGFPNMMCATYCYAVEIDGQCALTAAEIWEQCGTGRPPNLATMAATLHAHTVATLETLASALLASEEGSTEWSEAFAAYQNACADVGLHYSGWNDYLRGSDTVEELIADTLPRAIAAARSN